MAKRIVDVLVPVALDHAYSYRVPEDLALAPGDLVRVPLGVRECTAVVWADNATPNPRLDNRMKDVEAKLDIPSLKPELRKFVEWVSGYTLSPRGMVLRMALRMGEQLGPERIRIGVRLAGPPPARMTPARARVLEALADGLVRAKGDAAREAGVSVGVIDGLVDEGTLEAVALPAEAPARPPDPTYAVPDFSAPQATAGAALRERVRDGGFSVTLLDGVTGSGKTEVYFEAVAEAIAQKRQSLILMPEIALTAQSLDRFAARFGVRPAEWHSALSPRQRARTWQGVAAGEVSVVTGARSALFLPYADLGLVIVDEEHDAAYKQEDGVHYHARDMAVVRAHIAKFPVVLASATPSIETEVNARRGRYHRLHLPERFGGQHMPGVEAIDLTREGPPRGRYVAPRLAAAVKTALERGEQALLFLNRRGYAPLTLCRACGFRFACPHCDAWLVDHRFKRQLVCHHCGFATPRPAACPKCQAAESFVACGPGVERLEEEAATLFTGSANHGAVERPDRDPGAHARGVQGDRGGPCRRRHRHPAGGEGASFPQPQPGRDHRCRSRARQRRSPRGRAHFPAAAPGRRPRGARIGPRLRLSADPPTRSSGDAGADRLRPRGLLRERDCGARKHPLSAVRATREPRRLRPGPALDRRLRAPPVQRRAA